MWYFSVGSEEYGSETYGPYYSRAEAEAGEARVQQNVRSLGDGVERSYSGVFQKEKDGSPKFPGDGSPVYGDGNLLDRTKVIIPNWYEKEHVEQALHLEEGSLTDEAFQDVKAYVESMLMDESATALREAVCSWADKHGNEYPLKKEGGDE